ncbi:hypothetical protein RD792_007046 [Penstemon davidsonii]|uniref:Reticulon-like protein n=1 Tax=Penstemon davidsonii TaxID=160366 RepID=A0ABR0D743_9LAMI|nr:hypothetical protein RD792_007046 [Penstemon davidsonii]
MDSSSPSHQLEPQTRTKSASRLSKLRHYNEETEPPTPQLSLDIVVVPSSPKISTLSPRPPYTVPLHELLLLSPPPSTLKRSKNRLAERFLDIADDTAVVENGRKMRKSRNSSPRSSRRSRRRSEQESREEKEFGIGEEILVKPRKKRNSGRSRKDKSISIPSAQSPKTIDGEVCNFERIGEFMNDLVMWRDVSKSSLWFGFGSLCFLSSCFTKGVNFSIFSCISQVGLLFLGLSFFSNALRPRDANEIKTEFKLTEDDILKFGKLILPVANFAVSKARQVFSGEPAMTLKVVPFFLLGAQYGHLITLWRLSALCFFISFTAPKLYSAYSAQLSNKVEYVKSRAFEAWGACTHKKIVAASVVTAFWNLTSIRTRVLAAFLCLVLLRYRKEQSSEEGISEGKRGQQQTKDLVAVEIESKK